MAFLEVEDAKLRTELKDTNGKLEIMLIRYARMNNGLDFYEDMIIGLRVEIRKLNKVIKDKDEQINRKK